MGRKVLEIDVYSAIIEYNDGSAGIFDVLEYVGIRSRGLMTEKGTLDRNTKRIKNSAKKCSEKVINRRKSLSTIKKGYLDMEKEAENGESYVTGNF